MGDAISIDRITKDGTIEELRHMNSNLVSSSGLKLELNMTAVFIFGSQV
jgi:hypothetical protein